MGPIAPSSAMLVALGVAIVFVLLGAFFLYFYSPLTHRRSLRTSSETTLKAKSGPMAPVLVPSPIHTTGLEAQSLLDLSSPEQFSFPTLQPRAARATGLAASNYARDPIIREVYRTIRPQKRFGSSAKRYRPRLRRRELNLIDSQGSPIDLTTETNKQPSKNDGGIRYRPAHDHDANRNPVNLRWALDSATVFNTREEEVGAARYPGNIIGRPLAENMFFQWGLRYIPPVHTGDVYRSVLIEKLRQGVSLGEILPQIRGGQIYSASLCDTSAITKYLTALIVFVYEAGASAFLRRVEQEGLYVGFTAVSVRRVPTPTYLIKPAITQVIRSQDRTRCLVVASPDPTLKAALHEILTNSGLGTQVECFGEKDPEGVTSIRFHSIKAAIRAYEMLADTRDLKATIQFAVDPCSL